MKISKIFLLLTWMFAFFFGIFFWIAVGIGIASFFTMSLVAIAKVVGVTAFISLLLFIFSAILTCLTD